MTNNNHMFFFDIPLGTHFFLALLPPKTGNGQRVPGRQPVYVASKMEYNNRGFDVEMDGGRPQGTP